MQVRLPAASFLTRFSLPLSLSAVLFSGLANTSVLAADNSRAAIAERLQPVGELCLKGETCSSDSSSATLQQAKMADAEQNQAEQRDIEKGTTENSTAENSTAENSTAENSTAENSTASTVDGEKVYGTICMACHTTGAAGAPRLGKADDWEGRLSQGNKTLYTHAIEGIGTMPAKGGNSSLSDDEVKAAVDYLVDSVR